MLAGSRLGAIMPDPAVHPGPPNRSSRDAAIGVGDPPVVVSCVMTALLPRCKPGRAPCRDHADPRRETRTGPGALTTTRRKAASYVPRPDQAARLDPCPVERPFSRDSSRLRTTALRSNRPSGECCEAVEVPFGTRCRGWYDCAVVPPGRPWAAMGGPGRGRNGLMWLADLPLPRTATSRPPVTRLDTVVVPGVVGRSHAHEYRWSAQVTPQDRRP